MKLSKESAQTICLNTINSVLPLVAFDLPYIKSAREVPRSVYYLVPKSYTQSLNLYAQNLIVLFFHYISIINMTRNNANITIHRSFSDIVKVSYPAAASNHQGVACHLLLPPPPLTLCQRLEHLMLDHAEYASCTASVDHD